MSDEKIITSETIQRELNEERKRKGLYEIPAINARRGNTGTLARKDKSWSNLIDFIWKLMKGH
jgi:hypothetical protein